MVGSLSKLAKAGLGAALYYVLLNTNALSQATSTPAPDSGQTIFASTCATCHGLDGKGGEHAPNIATESRLQRAGDAALTRIIRNGIPAGGMPAFASLLNEKQIRAVLKYLRALQGTGTADTAPVGNAKLGRTLFYGSGGCGACHSVDGQGGFWGPDLTGYGAGRSNDAIREAILNPAKMLDLRRGVVTIRTANGRSVTGLIRNEDNFSIQLQTPDGRYHFFEKTASINLRRSVESPMPTDYGKRLSSAQIDDLISFIAQTKGVVKPEPDEDQ